MKYVQARQAAPPWRRWMVCLSLVLAAISGALPAAAQDYKWTMQSLWQAGSINHRVFEQFCANVKKLSGGRLVIEPVPVGTLVAYNETLAAVGSGILAGQQSGPG